MIKFEKLIIAAFAVGALFAHSATIAVAQKAPATKTVTKTAAPAKAKEPAKKATAKTATKKSAQKKTASACQGLEKSACGSKTGCGWIQPKKRVDKLGRKLKAYCRKVAGIAKSKSSAARKPAVKKAATKAPEKAKTQKASSTKSATKKN